MAIQKYGSIQRTEEHRKWNYISKCKTCLKKHCLDVVLIRICYILAIPSLSLRLILECNDILPSIIFDVKNLCSRILIPKPQNFVCVRNVFIFLHSLCHQYLYRRRLFQLYRVKFSHLKLNSVVFPGWYLVFRNFMGMSVRSLVQGCVSLSLASAETSVPVQSLGVAGPLCCHLQKCLNLHFICSPCGVPSLRP